MSLIESCECCGSIAPSTAAAEYGEWFVLLSRIADEELLVLELEAAPIAA
jgi:hypothetical protein